MIKDTYRWLIRLLRHVTEIDDAGSEERHKLIEDLSQQHIYIIACDVIYFKILSPATNTGLTAFNNTLLNGWICCSTSGLVCMVC